MSSTPHPPRDRRGFSVAIICALNIEASAVLHTFQIDWSDQGHRYGRAEGDDNSYTTGVVGGHNVVLAHMPGMGVSSASSVASNLRHSFPNIKLVLIVGICGGVPTGLHHDADIHLGDLVVGTAVVPYDFGRRYPGSFEVKEGSVDAFLPSDNRIRGLLAKLRTDHHRQKLRGVLSTTLAQIGFTKSEWMYPGLDKDVLYESDYIHKHHGWRGQTACGECAEDVSHACSEALRKSCYDLGCDAAMRVVRVQRRLPGNLGSSVQPNCPEIHFGSIGSGNSVIKSGQYRDQIAERHKVIAFEMEGAGIGNMLPSIVIKGVCDYADSHKDKHWQHYAAMVAAVGAQAVLHESELETINQPDVPVRREIAISGRWLMPFERDSSFVPRGEVMQLLNNCLQSVSSSSRVVLTGLGGAGKSQIAIEYGYQLRERAPETSVLWVHASNAARFRASYQSIAQSLRLAGVNDPEADLMDVVYRWLQDETNGRILLIIDNVDDMNQLQPVNDQNNSGFSIQRYLPQRAGASILITSRSHHVAAALASRSDYVIPITFMSPDEAYRLARIKIPSTRGSDEEIATLCEALDHLPLAITQAAAYIARSHRTTIEQYIRLLGSHEDYVGQLLSKEIADLRRDWASSHSVLQTWQISFTQVQVENRLAADILSLMAFFDRQKVPEVLLQQHRDDPEFDEAIDVLLSHAFIQIEESRQSFSTHRLVQLATRMWLKRSSSWQEWHGRALDILNREYPIGSVATMAQCHMLEPHAESIIQMTRTEEGLEVQLAKIMCRRAHHHLWRGNHKAAEMFARNSLKRVPPNTQTSLDSMHFLARALLEQGKLEEAGEMFQRVLDWRRRSLGSEHTQTLGALHHLVSALSMQGKSKVGENMLRDALEALKATPNPSRSDMVGLSQELARVLLEQQRYAEAETMLREVVLFRREILGIDSLETHASMHELARALLERGKHEESNLLLQEVQASRRRILGDDHPLTLSVQHDLARILVGQGHLQAAEDMLRGVLQARRRVLGSEHQRTLGTMWWLAFVLSRNRSFDEAVQLYQEAAVGYESHLGPDHRATVQAKEQLAHVIQERADSGQGDVANQMEF